MLDEVCAYNYAIKVTINLTFIYNSATGALSMNMTDLEILQGQQTDSFVIKEKAQHTY